MADEPKQPPNTDESREIPIIAPERDQSGLCAEAQADGVPCTELGRKCEICEQAVQSADSTAR